MKRIVSVSIGSSLRDESVEIDILGEKHHIQRIGTDGDIEKAISIIKELDGKVDAFGVGGINLYLTGVTNKKHVIKEAIPIINAPKITPICDGSGVKNTLEYRVINYLRDNNIIPLKDKKVLVTCATDRFRMTEAFIENDCNVLIGDLIFALGIPMTIKKIEVFKVLLKIFIPLISKLPFKILYPTGSKQSENNHEKFKKYYENADIIAGDFHYIKKYMPKSLEGKIIITNTVTSKDVSLLKSLGVDTLVTTTPNWGGRSFGTNVVEAIILSNLKKKWDDLKESDYNLMIDKLGIMPRIVRFKES
ncbi:MAG TPA: quinate 5-dehydrogenase [Acetivibrio saccincola]|uniref:quinate 5-dehydrogenase n=1 Tax=Acetivibrio saccincola TaxID=1677857 RepID=UPI002CE5C92D|nr:quinate 5-dehydrogenase [Acetivibrio saccincola]HOA96333.1 quinate 5-dehydrogenase [Acetivibrio saccincola]HQD28545.1 quinate 5-dehydrogenase [Acetivibrio saccincola]